MMLVLRSTTFAAAFVGLDVRGGILCSQTAQCASSPVGSPADGRHVCGACSCVGAGNEWSGRDMSWYTTPAGSMGWGGGGMGVVGGGGGRVKLSQNGAGQFAALPPLRPALAPQIPETLAGRRYLAVHVFRKG
jgi:hypothetical protein